MCPQIADQGRHFLFVARRDPGQSRNVLPVEGVGGEHGPDHRDPGPAERIRAVHRLGDAEAHADHANQPAGRGGELLQLADNRLPPVLQAAFVGQDQPDLRVDGSLHVGVVLGGVGAFELVPDAGQCDRAGRRPGQRGEQRHRDVVPLPDDLLVFPRDVLLGPGDTAIGLAAARIEREGAIGGTHAFSVVFKHLKWWWRLCAQRRACRAMDNGDHGHGDHGGNRRRGGGQRCPDPSGPDGHPA